MTQPDSSADPDAERRFAGPVFAIVVLLAATSGIVDAIAFAQFGVFVANQTGNLVIVTISLAGEQESTTLIACVIALLAFTIGVFMAILARRELRKRVGIARTRVILLVVEASLIAVASVGLAVWRDVAFAYVAILLLALSQAFQAAVVTRIVGVAIQTIVINTALVQSAEAWSVGRRRAAAIAFGTPIGYLIGAFIGALLLRGSVPAAMLSALITAAAATLIAHMIRVRGASIE